MLIDPLRSESLHLEKLLPAFSKKKVKTKNGHDKLNFLRHTGIHPIDLTDASVWSDLPLTSTGLIQNQG